MDTQAPTSQRSKNQIESWASYKNFFNKKLTLMENFSLEDRLRLSFFLAGRMEKEVPEERL